MGDCVVADTETCPIYFALFRILYSNFDSHFMERAFQNREGFLWIWGKIKKLASILDG